MSARFLSHLLLLLVSILISFIWSTSPFLTSFTIQFIAILVLFYFIIRLLFHNWSFIFFLDGIIFAQVTLLLVNHTGGISSPVFFLIYILLFGVSLLFDPVNVIIFTLFLCLFYFPRVQAIEEFWQLFGLIIVMPIALFFGKQYLQLLSSSEKIKILRKEKAELTQEVQEQEKTTKNFSSDFRQKIVYILDSSSNLLTELGKLNIRHKKELEKIHNNAKELLLSEQKLKEKIIE